MLPRLHQHPIDEKMTGSVASSAENVKPSLLTKRKSHMEIIKDDEDDPLPAKSEEGPQVRVRDVFGIGSWFHQSPEHSGVSVDVEHYIHEKSFRQRVILLSLRNSKIGIRVITVLILVLLAGCLLYASEALYYDYGGERTSRDPNQTLTVAEQILELVLIENKPWGLWALQVIVAAFSLLNTFLVLYTIPGSRALTIRKALSFPLLVTIVIGLLFFITVLYPPTLKNLYIPSFLLCWRLRQAVTVITIQVVQRQGQRAAPNTFHTKVVSLFIFLVCYTFSWICLLHHFMRIDKRLTLFDTYWFVMVTITTVGYGDIAPSHWTTRFLVTLFVIGGLVFLIPQLEELYTALVLQRRLHNSVDYTKSLKHIVVCSTHMKPLVLRDFLTEFYSDPSHYDVHIVVLVEHELPSNLQLYLSHPVWQRRITVLIGTPLRLADLTRARAQEAIACFLHTARNKTDPDTADQHTIMSAWNIKSIAPQCKLYVQILQPKNKLYLEMADHVVCEGELKNALLAASSHCPGMATLVTLLLHTFKPEERAFTSEDYKLYNKCAPCEVYDSRLGDSKYFHHFVGKNFLYAAVVAYRKYHVTLLGVRSQRDSNPQLNPDLHHILEDDDICYYIGFAREEYSKVGGASTIHTALWNTCANIGILSLRVAGIDPDLDETGGNNGGGDGERFAENSPNTPSENVRFFIPETHSPVGIPPSATFPYPNKHRHGDDDARRGLQLLRFHSRMDLHANPIVKVNLPARTPKHLDECPVMEYEDEPTCPIDPDAQHLTFDLAQIEEGRKVNFSRDTGDVESGRMNFLLQRSISDTGADKLNQQRKWSPNLKRLPLYSSGLSLISTPAASLPDLSQSPGSEPQSPRLPFLQRTSALSTRSHFSERPAEEVVLELEDIEEEEELEGLEGGVVPEEEVDGALEGEEGESPPPPKGEEPVLSCSRHKYNKGPPHSLPYLGFEHCVCHLLPNVRPHSELRLDKGTDRINKEEVVCRWPQGAVIVSCSEAWEDLYHFVIPLRACNLPANQLKPLVLLLEKEPSIDFLMFIAPLPMVYYCIGSPISMDSWLRAGIMKADSVVVLSKPTVHIPDQHENMVDAESIMAVQQLTKLFPQLHITTEIHYRYNIRFMNTTCVTFSMKHFAAMSRRGDHLTYLFMPQFAAGHAFCSSMLDTLLYQAHTKPYIIDLLRQLLGCKQVPGSGFLWTVEMTEELLKLQTYGRLFQRLASTKRLVPLGIYRTVPVTSCPEITLSDSRPAARDPESSVRFLNSRLRSLGMQGETSLPKGFRYQSFVLPNPPQKTELRDSDIILVLKPATSHSQPQQATTTEPSQTTENAPAMNREQASPELRNVAGSPLSVQSSTARERQDSRTEVGDSSRTDVQQGTGSTQASRHSSRDHSFPQLPQQGSQSQLSGGTALSTGPRPSSGSIGGGQRDYLTVPVECHVYTEV